MVLLWGGRSHFQCIKVDRWPCYEAGDHIFSALRWTDGPVMGREITFPVH